MQRFNQAWLLNPKNYSAFWGFGAVLSERGSWPRRWNIWKRPASWSRIRPSGSRCFAISGTVHSEYAARLPADRQLERAQHFVFANSRFTESLENDPNYAPSWREWAISLYEQERYSEAWIRVKKARELKPNPFRRIF